MSGQDWPVGMVATATVRGVEDVRVMRERDAWITSRRINGAVWHPDDSVTDVRPLVVLDLGPVDGAYLASVVRDEYDDWAFLADQIEAQTKPPRIPEPGLWGVVEASVETHGDERGRFVRDDADGYWEALAWSGTYGWDVLVDPVLVRPGIEDAP